MQTKKTNDAPHKEVVGVTKKLNFAIKIQIYYVPMLV